MATRAQKIEFVLAAEKARFKPDEYNGVHAFALREGIISEEYYWSERANIFKSMIPRELDGLYETELSVRWEPSEEQSTAMAQHAVYFSSGQRQIYNQPTAAADYHHWCKFSIWSTEEFSVLSLDRDPRKVTLKMVSNNPKEYFPVLLIARHQIVTRAMSGRHHPPSDWIAFAAEKDLIVPAKLIEIVEGKVKDFRSLYLASLDELEESAQTITSLQKRIAELEAELKSSDLQDISGPYLKHFLQLIHSAVAEYPAWAEKWSDDYQHKGMKESDRIDWLTKEIQADAREAWIVKKVLSDRFGGL